MTKEGPKSEIIGIQILNGPTLGPRVHIIRQPTGPGSTPGKGFARKNTKEVVKNKRDEKQEIPGNREVMKNTTIL